MPARRLAVPPGPTQPRHSSSPEPATIESPMKMSRMSIAAARMPGMPIEPPLPTGFELRAAAPGDEAVAAAIGIAEDLHDLGERRQRQRHRAVRVRGDARRLARGPLGQAARLAPPWAPP